MCLANLRCKTLHIVKAANSCKHQFCNTRLYKNKTWLSSRYHRLSLHIDYLQATGQEKGVWYSTLRRWEWPEFNWTNSGAFSGQLWEDSKSKTALRAHGLSWGQWCNPDVKPKCHTATSFLVCLLLLCHIFVPSISWQNYCIWKPLSTS